MKELGSCAGGERSGGGCLRQLLPGLHGAWGGGGGRDLIFTRQKAPLGAAFVVRMTSPALPRLIDGPGTKRGCPPAARGADVG